MTTDRIPTDTGRLLNKLQTRISRLERQGRGFSIPPATSTGGVIASDTPPPAPSDPDILWIDTDDGNRIFRWDGSQWITTMDPAVDMDRNAAATELASWQDLEASGDGLVTAYYQTSAPSTGLVVGDLWADADDSQLYRWNGSSWSALGDTRLGNLLSRPSLASTVADGQIHTWWQFNEPTPFGFGDLWVKTSDDPATLWRWNNFDWIQVLDWSILTAQDGVNKSLSSYTSEYAVSASETVAPSSGWSEATPTRTPGEYIWTRTTVTRNDGTTSTTNPALLTGNDGAQGDQGPQGIQGPDGADGQSLYTWIKYADSPTTGMADLPDGKAYFGIAYNKTTATESTNYADYDWSLIEGPQGDQGIQGPAGEDGQPTYTWIKYAPNGTPTDGQISDDPTGMTHIGLAYNNLTQTESTVATDYTWALIKGADGSDGTQGPQGPTGDQGVSVTDVTLYWAQVAETDPAPAQPTTATPSAPWTGTEPGYVPETSVYTVEKVDYSDSSFSYTSVSLSSSYEAVKQSAEDMKDYIASRGTNLVTNGTGLLGDNTNFSVFTFDASDAPTGAAGSFDTASTNVSADELLPVDPGKKFKASFQIKQKGASTVARFYAYVDPYDAYQLSIRPYHYAFQTGTTTTLAADLNPGDTTMVLTDSANWYDGTTTHLLSVIWWDYVDEGGKAWGTETYSRNWSGYEFYSAGGIDYSTHTITLSAVYDGPARPAGTPLSNGQSGGTYMYLGGTANQIAAQEWTTYSDTIEGIASPGAVASFAQGWPPGVGYCKIGWLPNRFEADSLMSVAAVSFSDASAAQETADNAQTDATNALSDAAAADAKAVTAQLTADGKNTIYRQQTRPWPDGDPDHNDDIGDVWWDTTPGPGSAWELVAKELTSNVATLTTADDHQITVGDEVAITEVDDTFNGVYTVTAVTATTVSYSLTAADVPSTEISQEISSLVQVLGVGEPVNVPYLWDGSVWNNARDTEVLTNASTLSNSLTGQDEAISDAQSDITALQERTDDIELTAYAADGRINISDYEPTPEDAYRIDDDGNQVAKNEGSLWLTRTRDRQNMLLNPSYELDTSSWAATGASLARVGATDPPDGANVAEITGDGLGGEAVVSSSVYYPVDPGQNIVLSGYAQLVSGNNRATNWSADDTTGWTSNNGGLYPVTLTSSDPISGSSSAMTTRTGTLSSTVSSVYLTGGAGGTTALTVTPGEQFSISVDVRTAHDNREANHYIQYRDSAGASLSGTGAKYAPLAQGLTTHTRLIVSDTVPAGAAYAYLVVSVSTTDGSDALDGEEVRYDNLLAGPEALPGTGYTARVGFYDDVETLINEVDGDPFTTTVDDWTRLFVSVPAPDLTTQMKVSFVSPNTDDVWRLDALLAEQSDKLGRYFDGGSKGGSWVGDEHVSESLLDGGAVIRLFELSDGSWVEKFWTADTISSVAADTIIGGNTYVRPEGLQPETMDGALVADNTLAVDKQYAWYVTASDTLAPGDLVNVWDNDGLYMAQRASAGTANQIYNPSFEEVLTGWFGGENTAVARVEDQNDDVSGSFVAEVTPSGGVPGGGVSGEAILSQYQIRATSVETGDLINASGRCTRTTTVPPGSVDLVIEGTDDADVFVTDVASVAVDTTSGYGYGTIDEVVIPAGVSKVRLVWRLNASTTWASGALRFDNHLLHKGRRIMGYFEDPVVREAQGFVLDAASIGDPVRVYHVGYNELVGSGLSPGSVYLATLPGEVSTSPPQDEGTMIQQVGFAPNEMVLNFTVGTTIRIV